LIGKIEACRDAETINRIENAIREQTGMTESLSCAGKTKLKSGKETQMRIINV
jgi:hypothetical protein